MIVALPCGCVLDDEKYNTVHEKDGHYPIGTSPSTYCKTCDLFKPCACGVDRPRRLD